MLFIVLYCTVRTSFSTICSRARLKEPKRVKSLALHPDGSHFGGPTNRILCVFGPGFSNYHLILARNYCPVISGFLIFDQKMQKTIKNDLKSNEISVYEQTIFKTSNVIRIARRIVGPFSDPL